MIKRSVYLGLALLALLTVAVTGGCKKGLNEKQIRRIVRDEVQEQLREGKRRQAARAPSRTSTRTDPGARSTTPVTATPKQRRSDRLRRRIETMEGLVARFEKNPGVSKKRLAMMKKQLARMRERLAGDEGVQPAPDTTAPAPLGTGKQTRKDWLDALAAGIRTLGKNRWEIDRRILSSILKNPGYAKTDAKFTLHNVGGKPRGFKLGTLRKKGLFASLGLKTGDVVERVNNTLLKYPKNAVSVFSRLSKARLVTVVIRRGGLRIVHVYTIK